MAKMILNGCWGGYGWSEEALDVLRIRTGRSFDRWGFNVPRDDAYAVALLEEKGSEFCSGPSSRLRVEEYDADLFEAYVDDYDGQESLTLMPSLTEARIRSCKNMDEVVELLRQANVVRRETSPTTCEIYSADEYECVYSDVDDEYDSYIPKHQKKVTV